MNLVALRFVSLRWRLFKIVSNASCVYRHTLLATTSSIISNWLTVFVHKMGASADRSSYSIHSFLFSYSLSLVVSRTSNSNQLHILRCTQHTTDSHKNMHSSFANAFVVRSECDSQTVYNIIRAAKMSHYRWTINHRRLTAMNISAGPGTHDDVAAAVAVVWQVHTRFDKIFRAIKQRVKSICVCDSLSLSLFIDLILVHPTLTR